MVVFCPPQEADTNQSVCIFVSEGHVPRTEGGFQPHVVWQARNAGKLTLALNQCCGDYKCPALSASLAIGLRAGLELFPILLHGIKIPV